MDREIVLEKLESLRRCIRRVTEKCPPDVKTLEGDVDLQDILALNLSRAVQLSVDIGAHVLTDLEVPPPNTMGQTFDALIKAGVIPEDLGMKELDFDCKGGLSRNPSPNGRGLGEGYLK